MRRNLLTQKIKMKQGFTLLETLTSLAILSIVIIGPLAAIMSSSAYARQTKDSMIATYLAEESVELLQSQYDSIYVYCKKQPSDAFCAPIGSENSAQIAWRKFKERFTNFDTQPSCYLKKQDGTSDNPDGCSYDYLHMNGSPTVTPTRFVATAQSCSSLGGYSSLVFGVRQQTYVCKGVPAHTTGVSDGKYFSRKITLEWLPTFENGPPYNLPMTEQYNDDVRVISEIGYRGINGSMRTVKIVRFMHMRQ